MEAFAQIPSVRAARGEQPIDLQVKLSGFTPEFVRTGCLLEIDTCTLHCDS